jgi:hypothetical protein
MTPAHARSLLTRAALDTTIRTLVALDTLQGVFYREHIEPIVRTTRPLGVGEWELAGGALKAFVVQAPSGNNQCVRMNSSAFISGLRMLDMQPEVEFSLRLCEQLNDDDTCNPSIH